MTGHQAEHKGSPHQVAGAAAGAAVGAVALGNIIYLLAGVNVGGLQDSINASSLALPISRVSLVSTSSPWCSQLSQVAASLAPDGGGEGATHQPASDAVEECTDLGTLAKELWARHIPKRLGDLMGQDVGDLVNVVEASLTGTPEAIVNQVQAQQSGSPLP